MDSELAPRLQESSLSPHGNEQHRFVQALSDVAQSGASEFSLIRTGQPGTAASLAKTLERIAWSKGFVVARIPLQSGSFEALDDLVRRALQGLRSDGARTKPGLAEMLRRFALDFGRDGARRLRDAFEAEGAQGDLAALSLSLVESFQAGRSEMRAYGAWLSGTELGRSEAPGVVRKSLSARSAKQAFVEMTRIIRALGHPGTVLLLTEGERITMRAAPQREKTYTVLRELIDNMDAGRGVVATRTVLFGGPALFSGKRSLACLPPLMSRLRLYGSTDLPAPHRPIALVDHVGPDVAVRDALPLEANQLSAVRTMIRSLHGLPPTESVASMSVAFDKIDALIRKLLEHSANAGSMFTMLTGDYGTGKTHLLQHLAERALAEKRPVFRLSLERLNIDLGNPQRHFSRMLEQSEMPARHQPNALTRLNYWLESPSRLRRLLEVFEAEEARQSDAGKAAKKLRRFLPTGDTHGLKRAIVSFMSGADLQSKPGIHNYRQDAYNRLLLWIEAFSKLEGWVGPVLLIDEAENLFSAGVSKSERRTALRSLSFYCGGALPSACVLLAITPRVLEQLQQESEQLLLDIAQQKTVLSCEDAGMLRHRLSRLKPLSVPAFGREDRVRLANKVRKTHQAVRGKVVDAGWSVAVHELAVSDVEPRAIVRQLMDRLELAWWASQMEVD